jgi:hypothetical protein
MEFILKIIDMIGGLDGIKKKMDGKKTYFSAVAGILLAVGWSVFQIYQFSQKQIDANILWSHLAACWAIISVQGSFLFSRMGTAKLQQAIKNQALPANDPNAPKLEVK